MTTWGREVNPCRSYVHHHGPNTFDTWRCTRLCNTSATPCRAEFYVSTYHKLLMHVQGGKNPVAYTLSRGDPSSHTVARLSWLPPLDTAAVAAAQETDLESKALLERSTSFQLVQEHIPGSLRQLWYDVIRASASIYDKAVPLVGFLSLPLPQTPWRLGNLPNHQLACGMVRDEEGDQLRNGWVCVSPARVPRSSAIPLPLCSPIYTVHVDLVELQTPSRGHRGLTTCVDRTIT
ncbi:hypothetical protein E2C01_043049 [Portunus trituberculatus]|uniref:Uncharacterized protein n=1 Tax=Portunus trituberculatus TaxID=210409 RepID=A0A5B7FP74_PORTR|nr:hypothetical protein [Portunus trituberculatus]